jgi:hypothetical protein
MDTYVSVSPAGWRENPYKNYDMISDDDDDPFS